MESKSSEELKVPTPGFVVGDLFNVSSKFSLHSNSEITHHARYSTHNLNYFALKLNTSSDLILTYGLIDENSKSEKVSNKWKIKRVPWFNDGSKLITGLSFDSEGILYIGTKDGTLYELNVIILFTTEGEIEIDIKQIFQLDDCSILEILIWYRDNCRTIFCNGSSGKLIIIPSNTLPILVTFISSIISMQLFQNFNKNESILICLENNQNLVSSLEDLSTDILCQDEVNSKKSLFRRAKDNLISRFGDSDKSPFFGISRKNSKDVLLQDPFLNSADSYGHSELSSSHLSTNSIKTVSSGALKFSLVDEMEAGGEMRKILGLGQFYRHQGSKLDTFESDFKQLASMDLPPNIKQVFVIDKIFFGVDEENSCIRLSIVHSQMLKEFAIIPFKAAKIFSIEPVTNSQCSVIIVTPNGIQHMSLKKNGVETCSDLLLNEAGNALFEVVCAALNITKSDAYILAGDKSAIEGKFAKTIIYYKVAGLSYSKIVTKFGASRMIPAMLCFYDLVDNEKGKYAGSYYEKYLVSDIVLLGKIEQFLRNGAKNFGEPSKNPEMILKNFIKSNEFFSSKTAASELTYSELSWAAKILKNIRLCHSQILYGYYLNQKKINISNNNDFWELISCSWRSIYECSPPLFQWFRDLIISNASSMSTNTLFRVAKILMPWRRELVRKYFCDVSDLTEIIDYTDTSKSNKSVLNEDYLHLFIYVILEILDRNGSSAYKFPVYFYKWMGLNARRDKIEKCKLNDPITFQMLSHIPVRTFSASSGHCLLIRNGRLYAWGENKLGRLGTPENRDRIFVEFPTPVNLSPSLKLVIESVSCGQTHTLGLATCGTIFAFGSNKYGQLGVGGGCLFSESPVFLSKNCKNVIFTSVVAGSYHSVAIDHLNRPWTWGWGIFGQLGNGKIENSYKPQLITVEEEVIMAAAGHSHTTLLTISGAVIAFGCAHFGQLGLGSPNHKVKIPTGVPFPVGTHIKLIEAGICSTLFVSSKNRIYYTGLNPSSIRSMVSGARRRAEAKGQNLTPPEPEERDFMSPVLIETSQLYGEIIKASVGTTHFAVLTNAGLVYTWGLGKNGQLMRGDDDCKVLGQIDVDERILFASNVVCSGECSWIVERDTGRIFGYGYNSNGQLGKIESEQEPSILTIKSKKRVLRVRQPANVYYKGKEIIGVPRKSGIAEAEALISPPIEIQPPTNILGTELFEWILATYFNLYNSHIVSSLCLKYGNKNSAALVYRLANDHENALKCLLSNANGNEDDLLASHLKTKDATNNCFGDTYRFMTIVIDHWMEHKLSGAKLEASLMTRYKISTWNAYISLAVKEIITETNERSKWVAANFSPSFIISCIKDYKSNNTILATEYLTETDSKNSSSPQDSYLNFFPDNFK